MLQCLFYQRPKDTEEQEEEHAPDPFWKDPKQVRSEYIKMWRLASKSFRGIIFNFKGGDLSMAILTPSLTVESSTTMLVA